MTVLGVDPGLTGALCFLDDAGITVHDMPTVNGEVNPYQLTALIIEALPVKLAAVEAVHSMPRQGVSSTFKFGRGYGTVLGVLAALEVPVVHVAPTTWTRAHGLSADKEQHRARALDVWPAQAALFARKRDDGRADACLIALWAWQRHLGEINRLGGEERSA